ncbi:MAG: hypothetical protein GXO69_05890 [Acidobacteria bacterium]|nr:hypothetical protein [Acidobacteriota bacterium]
MKFKKHILLKLAVSAILGLLLTACGPDPVQDDLIDYINNQIPEFAAAASTIIDNYNAVSGKNFKDDATLYKALREKILPECQKMEIILKKVSPKTDDVKKLHSLYVEAYRHEFKGFLLLKTAIEKQDSGIIPAANAEFKKMKQLQHQWRNKLEELNKKHNVELEDRK